MQEVVDSAPEDEAPACDFHHLTDLFSISGMVAVVGAVLAHGLGVHGAGGAFDQRVHEELTAVGAEFQRLGERRLAVG